MSPVLCPMVLFIISEELFVVGVISRAVLFFVAASGVLFSLIVSFVKAMGGIWGVRDVLFPILFPVVLFPTTIGFAKVVIFSCASAGKIDIANKIEHTKHAILILILILGRECCSWMLINLRYANHDR